MTQEQIYCFEYVRDHRRLYERYAHSVFTEGTYSCGFHRGLKAAHFRELHVLHDMACNAEMIRLQCQGVYCHQVPGVQTAIFSERKLCGEAAYIMCVLLLPR